MAKRSEREQNSVHEKEDVSEKLRDELFKYRVEIQSYKRSMGILAAAVSVILAVFAFFGYDKIDAIVNRVETNANARLAKTDSLISRVDMRVLDSLKEVVEERTIAYETAIAALERGTRVNEELNKRLISSLPYNNRIESEMEPFIEKDAINTFDIIYYTKDYSVGEMGDCFVMMGDGFSLKKDDVFLVEVNPKGRMIMIYFETFEVNARNNKLPFVFKRYERESEYELTIVLLRKQGGKRFGYKLSKPLILK